MSNTSTNTLYFVRHGENLANITKEFSYKLIDYSLTPKGVLQAEQTAEFFKTIPFDAVYASPLKRARETGEIIAAPRGLPVTLLEEFREVNVGNLELMPPLEETWRLHDQIVAQWFAGKLRTRFPGGENLLELVERAQRGLLLAIHARDGQRIVIAAHGGVLTALVNSLLLDDYAKLAPSAMQNCAVTELEVTTSDGKIVSSTLHCCASVAHLFGEAAVLVSPVMEYEQA